MRPEDNNIRCCSPSYFLYSSTSTSFSHWESSNGLQHCSDSQLLVTRSVWNQMFFYKIPSNGYWGMVNRHSFNMIVDKTSKYKNWSLHHFSHCPFSQSHADFTQLLPQTLFISITKQCNNFLSYMWYSFADLLLNASVSLSRLIHAQKRPLR